MRAILRTLPIRWQIPILHAAILAVVLAAGAVLLWSAQRTFLLESLARTQAAELQALIPAELDSKQASLIFPKADLDMAMVRKQFPTLVTRLFPPDEDPSITLKKLAILNPKLASELFTPGQPMPDREELSKKLAKLGAEVLPSDEDPAVVYKKVLSVYPFLAADLAQQAGAGVDRAKLEQFAAELTNALSARDRAVIIFAPDGSLLAHTGPKIACAPMVRRDVGLNESNDNGIQSYQTADQLVMLLPVPRRQMPPVALAQICVATEEINDSLSQLAISLAIGWALVVGLATALGVTSTRRVLRPLDQVIATTRQIAAGDLQRRVGLPPGKSEIAQLGAAFDAMVARLEASFATQRRFVADAAHELRTPLTALSASVELLRMGAAGDPATAERLLGHLDRELGRVIRLTNDLLMLSRLDARPQIELRPTDLSAVLAEVGEYSRTLLHGQELMLEIAPDLCVQGDADRLRQVALNLLDNARKYTAPGDRIVLRAVADAWGVCITVEDTGVGIPPEALPHLFERFYRVDSARTRASGGSGLGLAIVDAIVYAHGGQIGVRSTPGAGTCVTIRLPLAETGSTFQ